MKKYILLSIITLLIVVTGAAQDKLSALRSNRHIVTVETVSAPYYSIQILALKEPPSNVGFFKNFDVIKEYPCQDGYVRYCVGDYASGADALGALESIRSKGYPDAFVVNTRRIGAGVSQYANTNLVINPDDEYFIQLSAFRFPVYVSFFKEFDSIYEFRMNDKIFRYTTLSIRGSEVKEELARIKALGYKDAFIVEKAKYMPFRIE